MASSDLAAEQAQCKSNKLHSAQTDKVTWFEDLRREVQRLDALASEGSWRIRLLRSECGHQ